MKLFGPTLAIVLSTMSIGLVARSAFAGDECACADGRAVHVGDTLTVNTSDPKVLSACQGMYRIVQVEGDCSNAVAQSDTLLQLKAKGIKGYFGGHDLLKWQLYCAGNPCTDFQILSSHISNTKVAAAMADQDDDASTPTGTEAEDAKEAEEQKTFEANQQKMDRPETDLNAMLGSGDSKYAIQALTGGFYTNQTVYLTETYTDPDTSLTLHPDDTGTAVSNGTRPNEIRVSFDRGKLNLAKFIVLAGKNGVRNSHMKVTISVPISKLRAGEPFSVK